MSEKNRNQEKWRTEVLREQRKERLARLKSKDGGKKPFKTTNRAATLITVLVLVVVILAVATWWMFSLGVPHRSMTALTVGDEKITAAELSYFYRSTLGYYGIDPNTDEGKAALSQPYDETFPTVADFLKDQSVKELQQLVVLGLSAKEADLSLDAADDKSTDDYIAQIAFNARNQGQTLNNFLTANYGIGMDEGVMRKIMGRYLLANKYSSYLQDSFVITDTEIKEYYEENRDDFDQITYRMFFMAATRPADATDEQKKAAMDETKAKAGEMLGKITDEESFKELCISYAADKEEQLAYTETDKSLNSNYKHNIYTPSHVEWLFDQARKSGDKTILESTSGYYVLYFVNRKIADSNYVSVRHILVQADKSESTAEQITAAQNKAETILDEFKAGEQTETFFAELANKHSEDGGSNTKGGLYSGVSPGSNFVPEFLDWSVDPARKVGDTAIVQTDYGFHIMYFVGIDGIEWQINVKNTLVGQRFNTFITDQTAANPYKWVRPGADLVT
ncbi:MAG: peptidylprolyl isomerase [Saccharofermentanales bacterium]